MTTERERFEAEIFRPPHMARMTALLGEFTGRLDAKDSEMFMTASVDRMFATREEIKATNDIMRVWLEALKWAANQRPLWTVYNCHWGVRVGSKQVRPLQLRRKS